MIPGSAPKKDRLQDRAARCPVRIHLVAAVGTKRAEIVATASAFRAPQNSSCGYRRSKKQAASMFDKPRPGVAGEIDHPGVDEASVPFMIE